MVLYQECMLEGKGRRKGPPVFWVQCLPFSFFGLQQYRVSEELIQKHPELLQSSSTQSSRDLAAQLLRGLEGCLSDKIPFNKTVFYRVCPSPALDVFPRSPYESLGLAASKILFSLTD